MRFVCLFSVAVLVVTAHAADHPLQGDLLLLKDPPLAAGRRVRFVAGRDAAVVPQLANDPRTVGASLVILGTGPEDGSSRTVSLEPAFWRGLGNPSGSKGFRYIDSAGASGVRKVVFRPGLLLVAGGGSAWPYRVERPQGGVDVRFQVGTDMYCTTFNRFLRNRARHVLARNAPAPPSCSGSRHVPRCGDGVIEGTEECDDDNTADRDGCSAACLREDLPCGNHVLDTDEECDDGNRRSDDGCSSACRLEVCAGVPGVAGTAIGATLIASGLSSPIHITAPRGDGRLFVVEQPGRVRVIKDGVLLPDPFLDVADKVSCCGEQGLLSIAFHPDYATNGRFFVFYTDTRGDEVVARYQVGLDPDRADDTSERILITIPDFAGNHNGGQLAFGPDGYLYASVGDGGGGGDPEETGQDLSRLLGKILRLDVDVDLPPYYAIPPTNPFATGADARGEIWAFGLRNPWRLSFDRGTGDLYIGDVGQGAWEEIDVQPAASAGGENYGWDVFEGSHCFEPPPPATECPNPPVGITMPVVEYDHGEGCSVTGGFVYRGCAMPDLRGTYFYADFCTSFIRTFKDVSGGSAQNLADRTADLDPGMGLSIDNPSSFGEDARGELYIADYGGEIFKIVPAP